MSISCKYCSKPENKQDSPGLVCETCVSFVHLTCLRRPGTPGDFACDVFFDFTCEECSPQNKETFIRNRMTWLTVIFLSLYHLNTKSYGISNNGFFHYKTHICYFIDRNWQLLFGIHKQKKNWMGTIAGALSVYSNMFFKSGSIVLGETGWWKLRHAFSPAVAAHIVQEVPRDKQNGRPRKLMSIERALFITKITEMGYKDLMNEFDDVTPMEPVPRKKRRVDSDELSGVSSTSVYDHLDSDSRNETVDECADDDLQAVLRDGYSDAEIAEGHFTHPGHSDSSSVHSIQQSLLYYDSDSRSGSPHIEDYAIKTSKTKSTTVEEKPIVLRESLFSTELNSIDMPWVEDPVENKDLVEMTLYEEVQLLKHVDNMIPKMRDLNKKAHLWRLKANLSLRRLKAHKHLPVFDFDKTVKLLGGYVTEDPRVVMNAERILDRFQRSYLIDNLCGTIASSNYGTLILSHIEPTPFRSAFSGTTLKPYIRRDSDSSPLWLKLTDELLRKTNKHIVDYSPPPHATVDYSYLRPQHIAAVNNLCAQFFWPGIDLTEALQYPEFSCVVTYKRLVVGCAFLVPDVRHNEAYISFVLTRPEWRNAKIGSFMLYHLLQTCSGKDVTLHVSPANPAIFLYQKFGFKVEELIQDFYEKYYDIDYKGCRHALFLRLVR